MGEVGRGRERERGKAGRGKVGVVERTVEMMIVVEVVDPSVPPEPTKDVPAVAVAVLSVPPQKANEQRPHSCYPGSLAEKKASQSISAVRAVWAAQGVQLAQFSRVRCVSSVWVQTGTVGVS